MGRRGGGGRVGCDGVCIRCVVCEVKKLAQHGMAWHGILGVGIAYDTQFLEQ